MASSLIPIALAPMAAASGGLLAGAVAKAGGIGFLGALRMTVDELKEQWSLAVSSSQGKGSLGVGVVPCYWQKPPLPVSGTTTSSSSSSSTTTTTTDQVNDLFRCVISELDPAPSTVWISFWQPGTEASLAETFRSLSREKSIKLAVQVSNLSLAESALIHMKPDILVMQGCDAGGHGMQGDATSLFSLLPDASRLLQEHGATETELWAAGGIVDGKGIAAARALGAEVAVMGTRFVATPESMVHDVWKNDLVSTKYGGGSVASTVWDKLNVGMHWPPGITARGLAVSDSYEKYKDVIKMDSFPSPEDVEWYKNAGIRRNLWAGSGVGGVDRADLSASKVLEKVWEEYLFTVQNLEKK